VSITRRFVEEITAPYATKEWHETVYWNIKYCHYYLNWIKSRNLSSASLHESQERCVASSRIWDWTRLKQQREHNCAKWKDKGIFPTELHWWRKKEITSHTFNTLCI
jgi:hypothetical protein